MNNYLIRFKNDLRNYRTANQTLLKQCESELVILRKIQKEREISLLERFIKRMPLPTKITQDEIKEKLPVLNQLCSLPLVQIIIEDKSKNKDLFTSLYELFSGYIETVKESIKDTTYTINAFENDKIKDPINDLNILLNQLHFTTLTIEEISKILGMVISFNSQYAKKNKNHHIKNINIINALTIYYNEDGTFKYNEDIQSYEFLMKLLFENTITPEIYDMLFSSFQNFSINDLVELLTTNNEKLKNSNSQLATNETSIQKETYTISPKTIKALQELRKYYKNGVIIDIPKDLKDFQQVLYNCELDEKEIKYIMNLVNEKIANNKRTTMLTYLTQNEQNIYERAIYLLNSLNQSNGDIHVLKQFIEELQTILDMIESTDNPEDKEYLLKEIPDIIEQLSLICDKYTEKSQESSNRFIFLLDKDGIPYIHTDIDSLDPTYKKSVYSLISKIDKPNQSYFKKILNTEELSYNMYEVLSPRAHVAFVEVDAGIYVIIGANIPRNGYTELNNRLKANQAIISKIETTVKNQQTRNQILKANEEHLILLNPSTTTNKLILKPKNN